MTNIFSATLTSNGNTGGGSDTIVQRIASAAFSPVNASSITITLTPPSAGSDLPLTEVWIGYPAASGDAYDFDGNQVQVTFGGNASVTLTSGGDPVTSDPISFAFDHTKDLTVAYQYGSGVHGFRRLNPASNLGYYYRQNISDAATTDKSGYTGAGTILDTISSIDAIANSTIVAISDGGSATDRTCYSGDGAATFALATMPTFANGSGGSWRAVAYSSVLGRFVAVADHGNNSNAIAYSDDGGQTWAGVAFANEGSYVFTDICYSPDLDLFVIVASGGPDTTKRIITSSDGETLAEVDLPDAGKSLRVVEWSPDLGIFCAVGDSYGVTSNDGAAWTAMSAPPGFSSCYDICWCGGSVQKFLAVGSGVVASVSSDGDNWIDQSAPYCGTSSVGYACAWSDALGLAVFSSANTGKLSYTSDLATGSVGQTIGSRVEGLCWAATAGVFVAVGSDFIYTSGDGASWASQTAASGSWKYVVEGTAASIPGKPIVLVSDGGASNPRGAYTSDGSNWGTADMPIFSNGSGSSWGGACYSPALDMFVAVASGGDNNNNALATSEDGGQSWTGRAVPNTNTWSMRSVCWSDDLALFAVVTSSGPDTTSRVLTSPDGVNWTARALPTESVALYDVCWSADLGLFIAVGNSNAIFTSPDGVTWTQQTGPATSKNWHGVVWAGGTIQKVCAVAENASGSNDYMYSSDGQTWTQKASLTGSAYTWLHIAYSADLDMLIVVGGNTGVIARSTDGVNFTQVASGLGSLVFRDAVWSSDLGLWVITANGELRTSSDGVTWSDPIALAGGWRRGAAAYGVVGNPTALEADFVDEAALTAQPSIDLSYATFNPDDKSAQILLSNGDLTAQIALSVDSGVRATYPWREGKFYFEVECTVSSGGDSGVGIANAAANLTAIGSDAADAAIYFNSGNIWVDGGSTGSGGIGLNGTTLGVAVDLNTGLIWFRSNGGNWNNNASYDPALGVGGRDITSFFTAGVTDIYPAVCQNSTSCDYTANFGASVFAYEVPEGFVAGWPAPPSLELSAAFTDEATLDAAATVIPPIELAADLSDESSLSAALTVGTFEITLSADFTDEASLAAALTVGAPPLPIELGPVDFADESTLTAQLSFPINLQAALADDATLAAALTVMPPIPPPVQCVVVLTG